MDHPITKNLSLDTYEHICRSIRDQPRWRLDSDKDCDYYDGAQTSIEVLDRLKRAGMPAQDSNLIKPTINAVLGLEARSRTDYKVTSDDEAQAEMAEGLSAKIKEVETESRADRAMSDAYSSMIRAGVGWVEITRAFDPLEYPYRVREVHRNDIYWDWSAREPDLSDARYLRRDKWIDRHQVLRVFPEHKRLIDNAWSNWATTDVYDSNDTRMARAYEDEQRWSAQNDIYLNQQSGMVRLSELWYRYYEDGYVMMLPTGQSIEYLENHPYHQQAVAQGMVQVQKALMPRVRVSIWLGPHKLLDEPSPLPHRSFPYVPFWCFRKDRSRTPYGLIRDMRGPQDQIIDLDLLLYEVLNSVKVEVDDDALALDQNSYAEVAQNIQSLRSMTVLNANRRNANGFRVTREHALASQVYQLVQEKKRRIEEVGGVYRAMLGQSTEASSGVAISNLVEQGATVLAEPNDNFRYARRLVGEQLLALIKQDMIGRPMAVSVQRGAHQATVYFNRPVQTASGTVIENDIEVAQVKVVLEDIPSSPSFRAQQLKAFGEMVQAAPPNFQAVMYPAMLELSDVPNRHALAEQLRKVAGIQEPSPEEAQQLAQQQAQEQAIQQQAVQLGLAKQAADVKKTEAEAMKIAQETDDTMQQENERLRQQNAKLQLELVDKSEQNRLKARELDIKEEQVNVDGILRAEDLAEKLRKPALPQPQQEAKRESTTTAG